MKIKCWRVGGWMAGLLLSLLCGCTQVSPQSPGVQRSGRLASAPPLVAPAPYLRRVEGTNGVVGLDAVLRRFVAREGRGAPVDIWLVGVIHLGTSNYYARLQHFLDARDVVLFEGIGATNGNFQFTEARGFALQPALARALGLRFQLASLDYRRPNWVNSDLGLLELEKELPAHNKSANLEQVVALFQGEGALGGIARLGVAMLGASSKLQALAKLMLIETLSGFTGELPDGKDLGVDTRELMRVLIEQRNSVVVRDLRRILVRSPRPGSVAILYGAGHMPDLERRLRRDLRLVPVEDQWLRAFSVNPKRAGLDRADVELLRESIQRELYAK